MPNTLAHIGLQAPLTRLGIPQAPLQWIALGCIIPDIPWIVQRILLLIPGIDPVNLMLYASTQASLVYCLILALAMAMLSSTSKKTFLILAANALVHLLFDASQTKWGNGVHLLVPFSWQSINSGLFWPDHISTYLFTFMGAAAFIFYWPQAIHSAPLLKRPDNTQTACLLLCLSSYCLSPLLLINTAHEADTHYCKTLTDTVTRTGKRVELDRAEYSATKQRIHCYTGEQFSLVNPPSDIAATVSLRAQFITPTTLEITEYHSHRTNRNYASYAGLLLTLLLWIHTLFTQKNRQNPTGSSQ